MLAVEDTRHTGIVKWYTDKGFGVIIDNETKQELFAHHSEIKKEKHTQVHLQENEEVSFLIKNKNNKDCACQIEPQSGEFQHVRKRKRRGRNTTDFEPTHQPTDMRLMFQNGGETYDKVITSRDVIIVHKLFDKNENYYQRLKDEVDASRVPPEQLWKLWHGDTHFIADDHRRWKSKCPTFQFILNRIENYFNMDIKASRLNHYRDSSEWKPFHHDAAAVKKDKAATQNFTVAVSFGLAREVAFQHAKTESTISFLAEDCSVYVFTKDVNIIWKHGIRQEKNLVEEGRFSIIAWGWRQMVDV